MKARLSLLPLLLLACVPACADPVTDAEAAALPSEVPGIPKGPMHRGGQPCTVCHSNFAVAGTVYQKPTNKVPVEGVVVHLTDATGSVFDSSTNCAGNFYVPTAAWQPTFPLWVDIADPASGAAVTMKSKIGRDTACALCHADPAGTNAVGHVYVTSDPTVPDLAPPPLTCGRR